MTPEPVSYKRLESHEDRSTARLAARARLDTIYGGAKALTYAQRLVRMGTRLPVMEIVSDVYSASTGRHSPDWEAWACPECGGVHLGRETALGCCGREDED